ncbi:Fc.00g103370.m01.CDS01 [Cosmosporella sp. VM-42]
MALNGAGTLRRTRDHEVEDNDQALQNFLGESWKDWPNEAGFDHLEEHRGPIDLQIKGEIPAWAAGSLYRTGPGQSTIKDTAKGTHYTTHWFDGFAHTHKFDIIAPGSPEEKTSVSYSSRRQSQEFVDLIKEKGWRAGMSFGQKADPCVGIFSKFMSVFEQRKFANANVTVLHVPGLQRMDSSGHRTGNADLCIGTDFAGMQRMNPQTLEPLGLAMQKVLHPDLKGVMSCAHAQRDPETGDFFNYNLEFGRMATYRVFRVNAATGTTDILATVSEPDLQPAYIHSFFLTESYVVLCIPSSHFGWNGMKIPWQRNLLEAIVPFDQSKACRWIVVDRKHGKGVVGRFSTPAGFFFHSINAFEEHFKDENDVKRTDICLDYFTYKNLDILKGFYYDILLDRNDATKKYWLDEKRYGKDLMRMVRYRFKIPLAGEGSEKPYSSVAKEEISILSPHAGELPTINPKYGGKPYRYFYSCSSRGLSTVMDSLVKTDLDTREALIWSGPRGHSPGEPIFVARPGASEEDDGVLLSVVVDGTAEASYLLCLDARTMEELGRAETDFAIGMGFHGAHIPVAVGQPEQSAKARI